MAIVAVIVSRNMQDSFCDAEAYQDALQAMAMGKVYKKTNTDGNEDDHSWAMKTKGGILEMPTLEESITDTITTPATMGIMSSKNDGESANGISSALPDKKNRNEGGGILERMPTQKWRVL